MEEFLILIVCLLARLRLLRRRGYLVLMDSAHNTNLLKCKIFTMMIRDEYASWMPGAHMLASNEDDDIIEAFLCQIKTWCRDSWMLCYIITNNSAAGQQAVSLTFRGLIAGEMEVSHFLCRKYSKRTLDRELAGNKCNEAKKHL